MMDRIKEKKGKFNIFDALLILLILAVIAGGVFFFLRKNTSTATDANTKETPIHYTIRYRMISDQLHVVLQTGDTVYFTAHKTVAGKIVSVSAMQTETSEFSMNENMYVTAPYPGYTDYYVTIEAMAEKVNNVYTIDNNSIAVGNTLYMRTDAFASEATIWSVEEVNAK